MPILNEPDDDRYLAALGKMSVKVKMADALEQLERQEQRERTTPSIDSRVYHGSAIEADERKRVEEIRAWLLIAFVAAVVLAVLFLPRGPYWPVP